MLVASNSFRVLIVSLFSVILGGCLATTPPKTGIQLQSFQSKEFETTVKIAFASTVSVFQDYGYIIEAADVETGLITAKSPTEGGFMIFVGQKMNHVKASAFVEPRGNGLARIRLNFVDSTETSSGYGMKRQNEKPIEDPQYYQGVFTKIQQAIFVRSNI